MADVQKMAFHKQRKAKNGYISSPKQKQQPNTKTYILKSMGCEMNPKEENIVFDLRPSHTYSLL